MLIRRLRLELGVANDREAQLRRLGADLDDVQQRVRLTVVLELTVIGVGVAAVQEPAVAVLVEDGGAASPPEQRGEVQRAGFLGDQVGVAEPRVHEPHVLCAADVVVALLTEDGHPHRVYELSGPRALTSGAAVAEIAEASGRPMRFEAISPEQFLAELTADGVPAAAAQEFTDLFTFVAEGHLDRPGRGDGRGLWNIPPQEVPFGHALRRPEGGPNELVHLPKQDSTSFETCQYFF